MSAYIKNKSFTGTMHISGESGGFEMTGSSLRFNSACTDPQQFWFLYRETGEGVSSYEVAYKQTISDGSVIWPALVAIWQRYQINQRGDVVEIPCYVQGQNTGFGTSPSRSDSARDSSWRGYWDIIAASPLKSGLNSPVTMQRAWTGYLMALDRQSVGKNWVSNICCAQDQTIHDLEQYGGKVFPSKKPLSITLNILEMGVEDPVTL